MQYVCVGVVAKGKCEIRRAYVDNYRSWVMGT